MSEFHPDQIIQALNREKTDPLVLLESQLKGHPGSKNSLLAAMPVTELIAYGDEIIIRNGSKEQRFTGNAWEYLDRLQRESGDWLFGYLGYDLKNHLEKLSSENKDFSGSPDLYMMVPALVIEWSMGKMMVLKGKLPPVDQNPVKASNSALHDLHPLCNRDEYIKTIEKAQAMITEGEFYEINLTHPMLARFEGDPFHLYRAMREKGPVPFGAYIQCENLTVCSASPERFLKKSGNRVFSQPIKGTSPRSSDPAEDMKHKEELYSEKNRAENLMIVDLVRHDLSAIALPGTVKVPELYEIHSFDTVHQLISTIEAEADARYRSVEIIQSCFPPGSMTGAPKIRVMKTIDELETYRRGVYSGAIGYIRPDGDFDFNVVIRSAIIRDGNLIYPVGGAITGDSDPSEEWEETMVKTRALV
jgi:para-aminobenzoate synthetase component 1